MQPQQPQLDTGVVNLAKAIRQTESGGDFNAKGASGEHGGYQFMPKTWAATAPKYGINVPLEQATPEQQNAVAYNQIKAWKDNGKDVTQIASMWNAGEGEPDAYTGKFGTTTATHQAGDPSSGTVFRNGKTIKYDVPGYARSVSTAYQQLKAGQQVGADPQNPSSVAYNPEQQQQQPPEQGIGSKLSGRLMDASNAIADTAKGNINPLSGVLQTVGAAAGGVGDLFNSAIENIPVVGQGVKTAENLIGQGVTAAANTDPGKQVVGAMGQFAQAHPELSKDIGAGFDIATALPILKGVGVAKDIVSKGVSTAMRGSIEKGVASELEGAATRTIKGSNALETARKMGKDPVATIMSDPKFLPDVAEDTNGVARYRSAQAYSNIGKKINTLEDILQSKVQDPEFQKVAGYVPLADLKAKALQQVTEAFANKGESKVAQSQVEKIFDDYASTKGEFVPVAELVDMKRGIRKRVNFNSSSFDTLDADVRYHIGDVFMKTIEDAAARHNIQGIHEVNQQMGSLLEAQKFLKAISNKSVSDAPGWRTLLQRRGGDVGTVAGEAIGQSLGIPGVGAVAGKWLTNRTIGGSKGSGIRALKKLPARAAKNAAYDPMASSANIKNTPIKNPSNIESNLQPNDGNVKGVISAPKKKLGQEKITDPAHFERAKNLTPEGRATEDRAFAHVHKNEDKILVDYFKKYGKEVNTDNFRKSFIEQGYAGHNAADVQEPASYLAKRARSILLKGKGDYVIGSAGGSGAGKSSGFKNSPKLAELQKKAAMTLDSNFSSLDSAHKFINEVKAVGKKFQGIYTYRDALDSLENGVVKRMLTNPEEMGRVVPNSITAGNHIDSFDVVKQLTKEGNHFVFVDNSLGDGKQKLVSLDELSRKIKYPSQQDLTDAFNKKVRELYENKVPFKDEDGTMHTISKDQYERLIAK